jgi:two-component system, response regulator
MSAKTLLLVDDSPEDVQLTLHALRVVVPREHVTVCNSGEDALDYIHARGAHANRDIHLQPRLVLLDLNLPRITGLDVLRAIRAKPETRLLPVVILSASMEQRDIRAAMMAGANSYVRKSLDYAKLNEAMLLLARYWLELNIEPQS